MSTAAVLHKTGPDSWTALDGAYCVKRGRRHAGAQVETVFQVTTERFSGRPHSANCTTLSEAREAITAWEASGGTRWHPRGRAS